VRGCVVVSGSVWGWGWVCGSEGECVGVRMSLWEWGGVCGSEGSLWEWLCSVPLITDISIVYEGLPPSLPPPFHPPSLSPSLSPSLFPSFPPRMRNLSCCWTAQNSYMRSSSLVSMSLWRMEPSPRSSPVRSARTSPTPSALTSPRLDCHSATRLHGSSSLSKLHGYAFEHSPVPDLTCKHLTLYIFHTANISFHTHTPHISHSTHLTLHTSHTPHISHSTHLTLHTHTPHISHSTHITLHTSHTIHTLTFYTYLSRVSHNLRVMLAFPRLRDVVTSISERWTELMGSVRACCHLPWDKRQLVDTALHHLKGLLYQ